MSAIVKKEKKSDKSLTADEVTYFKNAVLLTLLTWQEIFFFFHPVSSQLSGVQTSMTKSECEERMFASSCACEQTLGWGGFFFLFLQLWWHRTGDPELWNSATWAAVPEGTTAGLQLCEFTLKHPPTWIKQSVWFCLPRHTELKFIYIKSPEASSILSLWFFFRYTIFLVCCKFLSTSDICPNSH